MDRKDAVTIHLTDTQVAAIQPLHDKALAAHERKERGLIIFQAFPDKPSEGNVLIGGFIPHDPANKIMDIIKHI